MASVQNSKWVVLKYGGTSVSSRECWDTIKSTLEKRIAEGVKPLVVCSAIAGISTKLEELLDRAVHGGHEEVLTFVQKSHEHVARELEVDFGVVEGLLSDLSRLITGASLIKEVTPKLRAEVLSYGELLSTMLGTAFLIKNKLSVSWLDARDYFIASDQHNFGEKRRFLSSACSYDRDDELINLFNNEKKSVLITQGFIARNKSGQTVLLGRGGSDLSASYFAAKLGAARCEIWTDVPGMYTANPHLVPSARLIKGLDYDEAQEIATSGAKVLHPRCITPLKRHKIPLHLYCLKSPDVEGTLISDDAGEHGAQVKSISTKKGIALVSMESVDMWHQVGFLADVFACFKQHGLSIDLVSTSETNVTVSLDRQVNLLDDSIISSLKDDLGKICNVRVIDPCALVSLVGRNIRAILHDLGSALEVFEEQKIYLLSQAANDLNLTFVVDEDQSERLVGKLHEQLFRQYGNDELLGSTWGEQFLHHGGDADDGLNRWWLGRRDELIKMADKSSPLYVYDEETVQNSLNKLSSLKSISRIFYSIKANRNLDVLKTVYDAGFGFECVSPGEVEFIVKSFPKMKDGRLLFTPNFASRDEYEVGFKNGAIVTLDNAFPLKAWPETFRGKEIFVRMDPGQGRGHHKFVRTAGAKSKFGISESQLDEFAALVEECGAHVVGLHAHVGSSVFKTDSWNETALFLIKMAERFPDVKAIDLGGGIGVVEKPGGKPFDFASLDEHLAKLKEAYPQYELWIEPGRFVVAEAGVLLAKVTQTKQKGDYYYVGVNAGMNTLIRPALYGSHHEIVNLSRADDEETVIATVVGPICETGDVLGYERRLATPKTGDVLLVATAGAYGSVMSSSYNLREPARECFLERK